MKGYHLHFIFKRILRMQETLSNLLVLIFIYIFSPLLELLSTTLGKENETPVETDMHTSSHTIQWSSLCWDVQSDDNSV